MSESGERNRTRAKKRFDRAMVDSTDLLAACIDGVVFPADPSGFAVYELGRLVEAGDASFRNDEFRFLIEQGIRLLVDPDVRVRAEIVGCLRRARPSMSGAARRITPEVIGAVEDADFSLDQVGVVVRAYTNSLFSQLERDAGDSLDEIDAPGRSEIDAPGGNAPRGSEDDAREQVEAWKAGAVGRQDLVERLRAIGPEAVPAVADLLFESLDQSDTVDLTLDLLGMIQSPLASRVLAYMVSEPILEEAQEDRVRSLLRASWPEVRTYVLYRLKQHSHEDIPFRWLELLVEMQDERAVDRILEEVVAHARAPDYREDLLAILPLLEGSSDPGVVGKLLRLMTDESAPEAPLDLLEEWLETSRLAGPVEEALERWNNGKTILVYGREDFHSFATNHPDSSFDEVRSDWSLAFHESLGWQQWSRFPRGPIEQEFESDLEETMMRELSLDPRLDDTALRAQTESFRESWLVTPKEGLVPLVAIYLERPRDNPWSGAVYWREINGWYVRAAQCFDEGDKAEARKLLAILLQIEPEYPFAKMLERVMEEAG